MCIRRLFLIIAPTVSLFGCARDAGVIAAGDRLEVRYGGWGYGASQHSVVETNGSILIGDCTYVKLSGKTMAEATNTICQSVDVSDGKTNAIISAKVRKIAPVPAPLSLSVFRSGDSNVVFRLTNNTTNTFRVPSAGYVLLNQYFYANTNPPFSLVKRPEAVVGLWLTRDWRQVGTNWMFASQQRWRERLKIRPLKPGATIDICRDLGPFADLANTNAVVRFCYQISQEWAEQYGLWEGSLETTGFVAPAMK